MDVQTFLYFELLVHVGLKVELVISSLTLETAVDKAASTQGTLWSLKGTYGDQKDGVQTSIVQWHLGKFWWRLCNTVKSSRTSFVNC